ncbi:DOMON domain-containing protein frrs1L [Desmophyllum pertusum]|uniref:DOMON domain-containing protein frrs1L n=1 Tax=Desmophyllum pertusum TaxID=174260 RepID=A0A9W9YXY9_9CNID|nr:DOMON domain-containing protein frrs1L [Desmophyllum pertusum]
MKFKDEFWTHDQNDIMVTVIVLVQLSELWAFPNGPPLSSCDSMFPYHTDANKVPYKPQTGEAPYNITVSKSSYIAGENLTVTISGSTTFKGFILHARGSDSSVAWPVGEFVQIPNVAQYLYCSGGEPKNTVAHNNPNSDGSLQFTWMAPAKSAGNISFVATIVHKYDTYWTNVASSVVTGPPAENVTRGVTTESFQIDKTGCGKTKGCYSLPPKCTGSADCSYLFTYKVDGGNAVIEMSAKQRWVAVGFNEQKLMDKMDSIMCVAMATNLAELRHYYSLGHSLFRQNLAGNSDLTITTIVYEDGGIKCRVSRKLTSSEAHFRDLTKKWYLLFAHGAASPSGSAQYHFTNRTFTGDMVDLSVPATLVDEQSQTKETISKDGCGKTKSCYSEPESCKSSRDCEYLVTLKPVGEKGESGEVEIEISAKKQWVAIGFNKEKMKMPGTDGLICADVSGQVSVDHFVVKGYDRPTKTTPRPASIVKDLGESRGGVVSCRFRRKLKDKDDKMVDLTEPWYLVYASGYMSGDTIDKHPSTPRTSPQKVEVNKIEVLGAEKVDTGMIRAHGCLMVIAWVGFASIGIFMARYMKVAFGDKVLLGTKVWFTCHRSLMVLTVLVTIIAIIIIFVHAGRWTEEAGAHPITGIIVLVLAVIQPIMALFRPHPGEANRYIFNWAHRGAGLSALILAVVTVFLGIRLPGASLDDSALYAMIAYCVGVAIVIMFEVFLSLKKNRSAATFSSSGGDKGEGHVQLEPPREQFVSARQKMLGFLVLFVTGVVIALVVLIATAEEGHQH